VSNAADAQDVTCDGRFAVVVGSGTGTPVSLVDLEAGAEVDTFPYAGLGRAVAACDDGQSVLVVLDSNAGDASVIKRLTVGAAGALADTNERSRSAARR
jgi:hypothetical protein